MLSSGRPMQPRRWYRVGASIDAATGTVEVFQVPLVPVPGIDDAATVTATLDRQSAPAEGPLMFAAFPGPAQVFNGKIDSPRIWRDAAGTDVVGAWDFSQDMASQTAVDTSANGLHGAVVNFPARAMTGWNWTGEYMDWHQDPSQWGAMHFHDDDIYDAGWETDFTLTIPDRWAAGSMPPGCAPTGMRSTSRSPSGPRPDNEQRIALVLPTASYLAYGNDHLGTDGGNGELLNNILNVLTPPDLFLNEHWEYGGSLYDEHSDGSGICYSSRSAPAAADAPQSAVPAGRFRGIEAVAVQRRHRTSPTG